MAAAGDQKAEITGLLETAEQSRRAGRLSDARTGFSEAARVAEAAGDDEAFVRAALGGGGIWVHEQRDVMARIAVEALWARALTVVATGSIEEASLSVRQAAEAVY